MSDTQRQATASARDRMQLLDALLKKKGIRVHATQAIGRRSGPGPWPLSFAQQRLWLLDQLEPGLPAYNIPIAFRLQGPLDAAALERSFAEILRRHESLRTSFKTSGLEPLQFVAPAAEFRLPFIDLKNLPPPAREAEARRLATLDALAPFSLSAGPLVRVSLIRLDDEEHIVTLTMHHIASDGWSRGIVVRETAALYEAFCANRPSPLPELPVQYADYALWQREFLKGGVLESHLSYWSEKLRDAPPVLNLPSDRPRPPVQTFNGASETFQIPDRLSEKLQALGAGNNASLFMVLVGAFNALLARYTGQEDIVIGTPVANRDRAELEGLIGFFINSLVLRTDLGGDPTFLQLLARVREVTLGAYAHQELPFEKIVEALQPERNLSHSPLYQVAFILENTPRADVEVEGLALTPLRTEGVSSKFDLTLALAQFGPTLLGSVEYNTDLFDQATVERMIAHYVRILEAVASEPRLRLSQLPLLTGAEWQRLVVEFNETETEVSDDRCVNQLLEAQARRSPQAVAVSFGQQQLTYEELGRRANQLARFLQSLNVGPDVPVALCLDRSPEMVVAVLGVLKAGGAYVPIDTSYPPERAAFILGDARARILLTDQRLAQSFAGYDGRVVCLDADWPAIAELSAGPVAATASPENLAYILYTSGSTGRPKGAMISHRGLLNYLANWCLDAYEADQGSGSPVHSSISFDLTVTGLFAPLLAGKKVVLVPEGERIEGLAEALRSEPGFSLVKITPAHLELLSQQLSPPEANAATSGFVIGGEALTGHAISFWQENAPHTALYNEYGPTEAVVGCCVYKVPDGVRFDGVVPIGRPIPNTRLYILDRHLNPAPIGVPGELHIGGVGLARGYLDRPGLTADRFIPDPFGLRQGARIYKTGDLARHLADGNIEYLGRLDRQLKIRGYRVELGEVEATLASHESVADAVVTAIDDGPAGKRLAAYVVFKDGAAAAEPLRDYLRTKLPDYMIPALFVPLPSIPLTPNGKVDLAALPAAAPGSHPSGREYVVPSTPVEEMLCGIWSEILGVERVGINDNFFELGGHSLLAAQVLARLREVFNIDFPLVGLFEAPVVADLAERIEKAGRTMEGLMLSPIQPVPRGGDLPLSFVQQRLWLLDQLSPGSAVYNIPFPFRISGPLNVGALRQSIEDVVSRHEILRTVFPNGDGQPVQEICPPSALSLPVVDLSQLPEQARERRARRLADEEIRRPFDVGRGPLMRAVLLRFGEAEHVVVVTFHHIIFDGWSMGLFLHEVTSHYEARSAGQAPALPELPIQYADFAHWQRQRLLGSVIESQLNYWTRQLGGDLPALELPTDRPRPKTQSFRGAHLHRQLPPELSESLKALSRRQGVTLFMTLLSALQFLLQRYSGQDDIVVGSPIASRPRVETENLIGCFLNTLMLRTDLSGDPTFEELLARVRELTLGAYAHQELPFEQVADALRAGRPSGQTSLFRVWFTYQNTPRSQGQRTTDLTLTAYDTDPEVAQFDLVLQIANADDGLSAILTYATDLFDRETVERMWRHFQTLLEGVAARPGARLSEFEMMTAAEREERRFGQGNRERLKRTKFRQARPKAINLSPSRLVSAESLHPGELLPLVVKADVPDLDLTKWVAGNREYVEGELTGAGGILFRGFQISSAADFEGFANASFSHLLEYKERSTPRTEIGKYIYTSTEYPPEQSIALHNEFSYGMSWPMRICFFCQAAPPAGGETPIADCRKVYQFLDPKIRDRFVEKKVMYARNYGSRIDLSWQTAFQTTDRAEVERYCHDASIDFEWLDGDRLRTRQVRDSVAAHPKTREVVWFNQAHLFHMSNLEEDIRESLQATFDPESLPRNAYYGDGSAIEDAELDEVREAIRRATVLFPWQQGDLLLLDNMLVAHGRRPYTGDRKILVAMADPLKRGAAR